jgi:hypothetical protein
MDIGIQIRGPINYGTDRIRIQNTFLLALHDTRFNRFLLTRKMKTPLKSQKRHKINKRLGDTGPKTEHCLDYKNF